MKTTLITLFITLPVMAFASIMFVGTTEGMSSADSMVKCVSKNKNASFTEVNVSESGDMVVTNNPALIGNEFAPFLLYKGMDVAVSDETITVQGQIVTKGGDVDVDLQVTRGKKNKVQIMGETLSCTTK
ncbi:hypothetical protein K2X05_10725 [bacterium]|nr:hypothetical protein [bacterium]